jgi:cob(I)alamin adenosyltransferase
MKIYTKTGDDGTTGLFSGERVSKSSLRVDTYGTVDELNSIVGIITTLDIDATMKDVLLKISRLLFVLGSDLATALDSKNKSKTERINEKHIEWLEHLIDDYEKVLPPLKNFILPGGSKAAAFLHYARTVCRRAERLAVDLFQHENIGVNVIKFLNRLSDFLFMAARMANHLSGVDDVKWLKDE